ncbi:MAG: hypothetical protein KGZ83_07910 [Sulfuricella sp.]|nr:hypothetical protein [Sulfuricella sp.]
MKRVVSVLVLVAVVALGVFSFSQVASAEDVKMVGVITKIELAGKDATAATVTLKDSKTEAEVVVTVSDSETLDKFKDHRIVEGDEIRLKYESQDGKNVSKYFRKTAGC